MRTRTQLCPYIESSKMFGNNMGMIAVKLKSKPVKAYAFA